MCTLALPQPSVAQPGKWNAVECPAAPAERPVNIHGTVQRVAVTESCTYNRLRVQHNVTSGVHTVFFPMTQQSPVGQDLLIIEASRSHSDTPHTVGLLWTSDQPDAETSTWQHTALITDRQRCPRGALNLQSQQASGRRPAT
jgi:hypothetical protein